MYQAIHKYRIQQRITELKIKGDDFIRHLCQQAMANLLDAVPDDGGPMTLKHLKSLPVEFQRIIRGWKHSAAGDLEVKWADPDKAWEMLAKHFGLLTDVVEVTGQIDYADMARRARMARGEVVRE